MFHTENRAQVQGQSQGTRAGLSLTCNRRPCLLPLLFPIVQLLFLRFMPLFCAASVLGYQLLQLFLHPVSFYVSSVQSLCRIQLCDPKDCSTPALPVHHQLPELAQTHDH